MKIGILTFHTACNFGAVLQAYALVKYLRNAGADSEIIDYRPSFNTKRFKRRSLVSNFSNLRSIYSFIVQNAYQSYNHEGFKRFIYEKIPISKESFNNPAFLPEVSKKYDIIICGSDQVWNPSCTEGDLSYFLPFEKKGGVIKASYAPSVGKCEFSDQELIEIKPLLEDFDYISVREQQGKRAIDAIGLKNNVSVVLDPTFLLNKKDWEEIADYSLCPKENYLLIYLMSEDKDFIRVVNRYAKNRGLSVIYICQRYFHKFSSVKYVINATPEQWVGLFLKAKVVATNSFHGTAFAINFGKDLFVKLIPRSISNNRMLNILEIMGCDKINDNYHLDKNSEPIKHSCFDYNNLSEQRTLSENYLMKIIKS